MGAFWTKLDISLNSVAAEQSTAMAFASASGVLGGGGNYGARTGNDKLGEHRSSGSWAVEGVVRGE